MPTSHVSWAWHVFGGPSVGVYAGTTGTSLPLLGGLVGVGFDFNLGKHFSIDPEIAFDLRRVGSSELNFKFTTLRLPLLLRFYPWDWLSFGAGGYASRPLGYFAIADVSGSTSSSATEAGFSNFDAGLLFALNAFLPLGSSFAIGLGGRYYYGLFGGLKVDEVTHYWREQQILLSFNFR